MKMLQHTFPTIYLLLFATAAFAQIGNGWIEYKPVRKIHLVDFTYKGHPKGMYSFGWKAKAEVGSPTPCSGYEYDPSTDTETFSLYDNRANRSEIRLENEYGITFKFLLKEC